MTHPTTCTFSLLLKKLVIVVVVVVVVDRFPVFVIPSLDLPEDICLPLLIHFLAFLSFSYRLHLSGALLLHIRGKNFITCNCIFDKSILAIASKLTTPENTVQEKNWKYKGPPPEEMQLYFYSIC